jgi:hypothetical protein
MPNNNQLSPRLVKKPQQSIVTLGRETTSIKLPSLLKRTSSTSNIYIQQNIEKYFFKFF